MRSYAMLYVLFCVCAAAASVAAEEQETTYAYPDSVGGDDDDYVSMTVFYTSHCEDCGEFFATQLRPLFCRIKEYVSLDLIPIGSSNGTKGFMCENDMRECRGNTIQNCVLSRISDPVDKLNYVACATSDPEIPRYINHLCIDKYNITKDDLEECAISQEGRDLMYRAELVLREMITGKISLPTVVFDKIYYDYDEWTSITDLEVMLCKKLDDHGYGDLCDRGVIINKKRCEGTRDSKDTKSLRYGKFPRIEQDFE